MALKSTIKLADAPDFFGPPTLAEILGVSRDVAYNLCHVDGFPVLRTNTRKKIISKAGLIKWLEKNIG